MNESILDNASNSSDISVKAASDLGKASGWVKAVAILGFIGGGFMALGGLAAFVAIPLMGFLYLIIAGAYIFLSTLLLKQANSIQGGSLDLDKFAASYYNFWKTSVIIMIIMFALSLIVGVIVGAASSRLF
jgi:hypothetical protein